MVGGEGDDPFPLSSINCYNAWYKYEITLPVHKKNEIPSMSILCFNVLMNMYVTIK